MKLGPFLASILEYERNDTESIFYPIIRDKNFKIISVAGFHLGETYNYFSQGLGEVRKQTIIRFELPYTVDRDGKVSIEGLINQRKAESNQN